MPTTATESVTKEPVLGAAPANVDHIPTVRRRLASTAEEHTIFMTRLEKKRC